MVDGARRAGHRGRPSPVRHSHVQTRGRCRRRRSPSPASSAPHAATRLLERTTSTDLPWSGQEKRPQGTRWASNFSGGHRSRKLLVTSSRVDRTAGCAGEGVTARWRRRPRPGRARASGPPQPRGWRRWPVRHPSAQNVIRSETRPDDGTARSPIPDQQVEYWRVLVPEPGQRLWPATVAPASYSCAWPPSPSTSPGSSSLTYGFWPRPDAHAQPARPAGHRVVAPACPSSRSWCRAAKRFAQAIGVVFSTTTRALYGFGEHTARSSSWPAGLRCLPRGRVRLCSGARGSRC